MSRQREKGTRFETAVAGYLRGRGVAAERVAMHGSADRGDLRAQSGGVEFTVECKDRKRYDFARAVDEAEAESLNAGTSFGVAVTHRPGFGAASMDGNLVHMTLGTFCDLMGWLR